MPGVFGVFYYRSPKLKTLNELQKFFPVPIEELKTDFASGRSAENICAESINALLRRGVRNIYLSNLPITNLEICLERIEALVENV